MKMSIEVPDEWGDKLDELAKQDGHSNRAAVIRKIVNSFFAEKQNILEHCKDADLANSTEPEK